MSDNFRFVDAHFHLIDYGSGWHPHLDPWTSPEPDPSEAFMGPLDKLRGKDFLVADFRRVTDGYDVVKAVFVTAAVTPPTWPAETAWVQTIIDQGGFPNAIIGFTDFARPVAEVAAELDVHAQNAAFRGLRHASIIDYESEHTADCLAAMQDRNLIYDVCAHEGHLPAVAKLVPRFGDMNFVLEHAGWPSATDDATFAVWRDGMQKVASASNIAVKISGLGMAMHDWTVDDLRPWVEATIDAFGPSRCMFASNFPVDSLYSDFGVLLEAYREITSDFSATERDDMFVRNAERWYRI